MSKGSGRTKNLRFGIDGPGIMPGSSTGPTGWERIGKANLENQLHDLFEDDSSLGLPAGVGVDDMTELIYDIDLEGIGNEANTLASSNVQNLLRLYNNKEFTDNHPDFKRRIDTEIDSLRKLYKMAKVNEIVHDHLVLAITKNPGNASLYRAMDAVQGKMLSVDTKIREQISNFNKIITGYQLELNFSQENNIGGDSNTNELDDGSIMSRGNKAFIEQMRETLHE